MQLTQGRNIIPRKNKQLAYGVELQNILKEQKRNNKKLRGNK